MASQAVKRACDACHRRKVKCDGVNPCRNCSTAQLACTYNAIPQKKGPKGSRAKVISELRENQRQTSLHTKVQNRIQGIPSPPLTPLQLPAPGLVTGELVRDSMDFFFCHMYGHIPILDRRTTEHHVVYMEQNRDAYCMLTSLAAFTMLQPGKSMPAAPGDPYCPESSPLANITSSALLVEEVLRVRKGYDYTESPDGCVSLNTLATNFFLFACANGIECHDKAWYYLREATTMMLMGCMDKEETYHKWDPVESALRRRTFWLFYIAERAYALQRNRPLTLQATINLPTLNDDPSDPRAHQTSNFLVQANIFRSFDDGLTALWHKARNALSPNAVIALQKQMNEVLGSVPARDPQLADPNANSQWLRSTHWQLTAASDDSFRYSPDPSLLASLASGFPAHLNLVGSGLIERMLEIGHMLADYLSIQPTSGQYGSGSGHYLSQILNVVAVVRSGSHQFLPLLLLKLNDGLPRITCPMLVNAPEDSHLANFDIFDGFGNAGMAPLHMMDTDYETKFSMPDYEKRFPYQDMNGSPSDSGSSPDLGSQFTGSPGLVPTGIGFAQGLADYALGDMIMSPMSGVPGNPLNHTPQNGLQRAEGHHLPSQQPLPTPTPVGSAPHGLHGFGGGALGLHGGRAVVGSSSLSAPGFASSVMPPQGLHPSPMSARGIHSSSMPTPQAHHALAGPGGGGGGGGNMMGAMGGQQHHSFPCAMQRANSYAMPQPHAPIPRTMTDFGVLQIVKTEPDQEMSNALAGMTEIDFASLR